jgi:hypothetical protein
MSYVRVRSYGNTVNVDAFLLRNSKIRKQTRLKNIWVLLLNILKEGTDYLVYLILNILKKQNPYILFVRSTGNIV